MSDPPTFADQLAALVLQCEELLNRASEIAEMRAKDGRQLGATALEQLALLSPRLAELSSSTKALVAGEQHDATQAAALREAERFERQTKRGAA